MTARDESGVLDTCTYLDLDVLDPAVLPIYPEITTITLAELHQGVSMARNAVNRAARTEQLGKAIAQFAALPFDDHAAARYGTLVSLTLEANRDPKPRKLDLMIAAVASTQGLPLHTRTPIDFKGLAQAVRVVEV